MDARGPRVRPRDIAARLGCSRAESAALAILAAGAVAAVAVQWVLAQHPSGAGASSFGVPTPLASDRLVVHVTGAVATPGLYRVAPDARVADALDAAGGPSADAALGAVNLARPVRDGEQLVVPAAAAHAGTAGEAAVATPSAHRPDGKLDLNLATAEDFENLPGIGPVLAERIVAHRDDVGGFQSVGDLRSVPGIGEKKFQALAELVTV